MKEVMQKALDAIHLYLWAGDKHLLQDAHEAFRTTLLQRTLPVLPEPLEYWNAVEGWVKIDEVREHFDAVNCGTIYKHGGEGRVPLYTAPPQQQSEPPPEWLLIKNILDEYGLQAIDFVADWKAAQRPWVGLTDEEMSDIVADIDVDFGDLLWKVVCLTKIIEATLKERNT